jgi:F420-0:gamma-glutamyl ligase-like protein
MEALGLIIAIGIIILIGMALYEPVVVIGYYLWLWIRLIWPFLLGIIIGLPIWSINQPLGNNSYSWINW